MMSILIMSIRVVLEIRPALELIIFQNLYSIKYLNVLFSLYYAYDLVNLSSRHILKV